jgi:DNA-binding MarR family transcriptional regulator
MSDADFLALAEFRYQLRRFLVFSERAAKEAGLAPRQHQLLLAVRGLPPGVAPTIGTLSGRLVLRHHTVVELVDRLSRRGLVSRRPSPRSRREIYVAITPAGAAALRRLSKAHRTELRSVGATLVSALSSLTPTLEKRRARRTP